MKKTMWGALALLVLVGSMGVVSAFGNKFLGNREEIETALESGDFNGWKSAMEAELTEERFNQMVQRHSMRKERRQERPACAAREALEFGDYEAYVEAYYACRLKYFLGERKYTLLPGHAVSYTRLFLKGVKVFQVPFVISYQCIFV